jgi:nitrogen regulatory protein PII 1
MAALKYAGFQAVTKIEVYGRGKQRGLKVGEVTYDELPKELLFTVVDEKDKNFVVDTIIKAARSGAKGSFGDGKVIISPVSEVYTVSSGIKEVSADAFANEVVDLEESEKEKEVEA